MILDTAKGYQMIQKDYLSVNKIYIAMRTQPNSYKMHYLNNIVKYG